MSHTAPNTVLRNARIVLENEIITGSIAWNEDGIIAIDSGPSTVGEDVDGDVVLAGLVELHTDHLENHYGPRPGVRWNTVSAIQAHDAQVASSGITTVFDCLRMGTDEDGGWEPGEMRSLAQAMVDSQAQGRLRSEHFIHLRCEVSSPDVLEDFASFADVPTVRLASLMDHAPGQRQFQTMDQYTLYYKTKRGLTDAQFEAFVARRVEQSKTYSEPHRLAISEACRAQGIALASHDDATLDHVDDAKRDGVALAEFPTSVEAARASHESGMSVLMGAPNIVRGGSHSGNIAAIDLARLGLLDVLSSDYVPLSLIHAPFAIAQQEEAISLPQAIAMVTAIPAHTVGLDDRGTLEVGKRADIVRVQADVDGKADADAGFVPVVRSVWRQGTRVA
ncbi:MAG: alpha-D-ribose 1-methylphosphonate 5-triphosphate diphosphatase [Pseudomonadota bacterium]